MVLTLMRSVADTAQQSDDEYPLAEGAHEHVATILENLTYIAPEAIPLVLSLLNGEEDDEDSREFAAGLAQTVRDAVTVSDNIERVELRTIVQSALASSGVEAAAQTIHERIIPWILGESTEEPTARVERRPSTPPIATPENLGMAGGYLPGDLLP